MQGGGGAGPFYHVNDISVYLGRQRGEGSPVEETSLRPYLVVSVQSAGVSNVHKVKAYHFWFKTKNACTKCILSIGNPSPALST